MLQVLATYRLIAPGSEWRLHRQWFLDSAMADLLGADFGLAEAHKLYACHDMLLAHKQALFSHLTQRWRDLFNASFDVLLYDLTSTYFEVNASDLPEGSTSAATATAATSGPIARNSSSPSSSPRKACRSPTRSCPATPPTARRCGRSSTRSRASTARRGASG